MTTITINRAVVEQAISALEMTVQISDDTLTTSNHSTQRQHSLRTLRAALQSQAAAEPEQYGLEPWEKAAIAPVATLIFPKHSPDKPFIALGSCANLYPDAAQTKPLYTTPPAVHAALALALGALNLATESIGAFTSDEGSGQKDFDNMDTCLAAIAAIEALGVKA